MCSPPRMLEYTHKASVMEATAASITEWDVIAMDANFQTPNVPNVICPEKKLKHSKRTNR